jgi:hypothetical protein
VIRYVAMVGVNGGGVVGGGVFEEGVEVVGRSSRRGEGGGAGGSWGAAAPGVGV